MNNVEESTEVISRESFIYETCLVFIDKFREEPV